MGRFLEGLSRVVNGMKNGYNILKEDAKKHPLTALGMAGGAVTTGGIAYGYERKDVRDTVKTSFTANKEILTRRKAEFDKNYNTMENDKKNIEQEEKEYNNARPWNKDKGKIERKKEEFRNNWDENEMKKKKEEFEQWSTAADYAQNAINTYPGLISQWKIRNAAKASLKAGSPYPTLQAGADYRAKKQKIK